MTAEELKALQEKVAADAKKLFEKQDADLQSKLNEAVNAAVEKLEKGMIKKEDFQPLLDAAIKEYGEKATNLEQIARKQGDEINGLKAKFEAPAGSFTDLGKLLDPYIAEIKAIHRAGSGFITIDAKATNADKTKKHPHWADAQQKAAETSIANSILPMGTTPVSPYAPGISNVPLSIYEIARNPTFVSNYVNMGTTDLSRLAWINETALSGLPTIVAEAGSKPLTSRTFTVEFSQAKKIAAYIGITEEFDTDLPYLSTAVRRLLQMDIVRAFDLQVQADVQANATQLTPNLFTTNLGPNNLTLLPYKNAIFDATIWDALFVMGSGVRLANFIPNLSLLNTITYGKMVMNKDSFGRYNIPPDEMVRQINPQQGNNLYVDYALVGDLKQFNVDIYEDFTLKIGWINDDFIRNQFTIVAEVRFHDYISLARKQAIMYGDTKYIAEQIFTSSNAIVGS